MKITFKHCRIATAIIVALSVSSCARFETRMQANGSFDYQQVELKEAYESGTFTTHEARSQYDLPALTAKQKAVGQQGIDVDIRPPTQLMPIIDGVLLGKDTADRTKVWFNSVDQSEQIEAKIWGLIESYLAENKIDVVTKDAQGLQTGIYSEVITFDKLFGDNVIVKESSYQLSLDSKPGDDRVGLVVDALSYAETSQDKKLKLNLVGSTKQDIELRFVNKLLHYAYSVEQSEHLAALDSQPLAIKLGFDDNHQSAWIVESNFEDTWRKVPQLLALLNFELVDDDRNLGYYLMNFSKPSSSYWVENNLQPFTLKNGEYFIQLGEVNEGTTSIGWLDSDKKPLSDEKITEIYLSIKDKLRDALIEKDKQTKKF